MAKNGHVEKPGQGNGSVANHGSVAQQLVYAQCTNLLKPGLIQLVEMSHSIRSQPLFTLLKAHLTSQDLAKSLGKNENRFDQLADNANTQFKKDVLWKPLIRLFRRFLKKDALLKTEYRMIREKPI